MVLAAVKLSETKVGRGKFRIGGFGQFKSRTRLGQVASLDLPSPQDFLKGRGYRTSRGKFREPSDRASQLVL